MGSRLRGVGGSGDPERNSAEYAPPDSEGTVVPGSPVTLAECLDLALRQNPRTRSAYLAAQAARAQVGVAKSDYLFNVTVNGSTGIIYDRVAPGREPETGWRSTGSLSVAYLIFDGGGRGGRLDGARARLSAVDFGRQTVLLDVALDVELAYYQLQGALWFQHAAEEIIKQYEYQHDLAVARLEFGFARPYDVTQSKARLAQAKLLRTEAAAQARQGKSRLAQTMGLAVDSEQSVEELQLEGAPAVPVDIEWLMTEAVRARPEIAQSRAAVEEALANHRAARSGYFPTVAVEASVTAMDDTRTDWGLGWGAMLGVSLPIFSGFRTSYAVQAATFDEERAREELTGRVTDVQFEVWTAHSVLLEALETTDVLRQVVEASEASVSLAEEDYKAGLGSMLEVMDAQATRASARLEWVRARVAGHMGFARLSRAVGTTFFDGGAAMVGGGNR